MRAHFEVKDYNITLKELISYYERIAEKEESAECKKAFLLFAEAVRKYYNKQKKYFTKDDPVAYYTSAYLTAYSGAVCEYKYPETKKEAEAQRALALISSGAYLKMLELFSYYVERKLTGKEEYALSIALTALQYELWEKEHPEEKSDEEEDERLVAVEEGDAE